MLTKQYQTLIPVELREAVSQHGRALIDGDNVGAEAWVEAAALEGYRAAAASAADLRPLQSFELIAHARLGFQFIVKVRFLGAEAKPLTLQVRWRQDGRRWRIVEVDNLNLRSPWHRPSQPAQRNVNG
jgi:hypothetical protein